MTSNPTRHQQCKHPGVEPWVFDLTTDEAQHMHDDHHAWLIACFGVFVDPCTHWTAGDNWLYALRCETRQIGLESDLTWLLQQLESSALDDLKSTCLRVHILLSSASPHAKSFFLAFAGELVARAKHRKNSPVPTAVSFACELEAVLQEFEQE